MRPLLTAFALALATGALGGSAVAGGGDDQRGRRYGSIDGGQCFNARLASGFRPVGRDQLDITLPGRRVYRLDLAPGCDVDRGLRIALRSRTGSFICNALDAEVIAPSQFGRGVDRCLVTGMRRIR